MNKILQGDALSQLKTLPEKSVNMCMTSPPYWALRDYGTASWEGGDENCEHVINKISEFKGDWDRPSRKEFNDVGEVLECVVCKKQFKGKLGNKFCSTKCLNTLSNDKRTNAESKRIKICSICGAKHVDKQLGLEPTFDQYISNLCDIFDEVKRVLRDDGTCWVNLGDTYFGSGKGAGGDGNNKESFTFTEKEERTCNNCGKKFIGWKFQNFCGSACSGVDNTPRTEKGKLPDKTLTMIPMRFAIEMVNRGWILRNTIIWHKPNAMPSSVKDRFTVDFEYVFFFVKKKKYYFETQYEPNVDTYNGQRGSTITRGKMQSSMRTKQTKEELYNYATNGRNKRTVWTICPRPFKEAHFAVYPEELCETPIKAGCPEFVCVRCGMPKIRIYEDGRDLPKGGGASLKYAKAGLGLSPSSSLLTKTVKEKIDLGYKPTCKCNAEFTGGIVLDPFFGAGTTGLVALKQKKKFIGIELNPEYIEIATKRLKPFLEQKKLTEVIP